MNWTSFTGTPTWWLAHGAVRGNAAIAAFHAQ
jgi:hypothetical protein